MSWKEKAIKLAKETDLSQREIAKKVKQPKSTVHDLLKKYEDEIIGNVVPKILLFDVETSPQIHYAWSRYDKFTSQSQVLKESHLLCWSAKWLDSSTVISDALWFHEKEYKKDPTNDKKITESLYKLLDEADFLITQNGDKFDIKVMNTRFILHDLYPPHPSKSIDTLKIARRKFKFPSNKLGDVAQYLGLTDKMDTGGFGLWSSVLDGDGDAQKKMVAYCEQDVLTLQEYYLKLRPWDDKHPNINLVKENVKEACVACGSEKLKVTGKSVYSPTNEFEALRCSNCGKINRRRKGLKTKKERDTMLGN